MESDTVSVEETIVFPTLHPVNFKLVEAEKTRVVQAREKSPAMLVRPNWNTQFLTTNYVGEVACFVELWKSPEYLQSDSKSPRLRAGSDEKDAKEDSKADSLPVPDTMPYVEVVPELSNKAKRKLAVALLAEEKDDGFGSEDRKQNDSDDDDDDDERKGGRGRDRKDSRGDSPPHERRRIRFESEDRKRDDSFDAKGDSK